MSRESPTKNSEESVLIERRPHLIWEVAPAALMSGIKLSRLHFNGDQVGQRMNNRNKRGRFVRQRRRYARSATEPRSMLMHFSLSNSWKMSETTVELKLQSANIKSKTFILFYFFKSRAMFSAMWGLFSLISKLFVMSSEMVVENTPNKKTKVDHICRLRSLITLAPYGGQSEMLCD